MAKKEKTMVSTELKILDLPVKYSSKLCLSSKMEVNPMIATKEMSI